MTANLAGLLLPALLLSGCDENLLNPMAFRQPREKAYDVSHFFADGLSMRAAPRGTVAREARGDAGGFAAPGVDSGYARAGGTRAPSGEVIRPYLTAIPVPVTRALLAEGRHRFEIVCATCHGLLGDGHSVVARQMALRPPPSLHLYADRPPGFFFEAITRGAGLMPAHAAELAVEDRWAVVAYLRALMLSQQSPLASAPPEERARLEGEGGR
jgi:mono/diheme cytochrome c family protein